jgi:hypothetical protein
MGNLRIIYTHANAYLALNQCKKEKEIVAVGDGFCVIWWGRPSGPPRCVCLVDVG